MRILTATKGVSKILLQGRAVARLILTAPRTQLSIGAYFAVVLFCIIYIVPIRGIEAQNNMQPEIAPTREAEQAVLPKNVEERKISVLIVPHHLVAAKQIGESYAYTAAAMRKNSPKRIILMGPNHFFRGTASTLTSRKTWQTEFGEINPDTKFLDLLALSKLAAEDDGIVKGDHSITAHLPYIKQYFPEAELTPLLLREPFTKSQASAFANFLNNNSGEETLIIASVDFSHYLPKVVADKHDELSIEALQNLDGDFFEKKIDADSRHILMILADYLRMNGNIKFTLLAHTNSALLLDLPADPSTTSHIMGIYE